MNKKNIYLYKNALNHIHDESEIHFNTVPLSKKGIHDYFNIVDNHSDADYFYMGQISNEQFHKYNRKTFEFFNEFPERHIVDIEGEGGMPLVPWIHDCIITTMGPLKQYSNIKHLFTRPTFSHLFLDIIKNRNEEFSLPTERSFGFRGFMNHKIRAMMVHALHNSDFKKELHINRAWSGPSIVGGDVQNKYIDTMNNNLISLCPRGSGIDSVRLIETCYYQRVPVLISDHDYYLFGEDAGDLDFVYRITGEDLTPQEIRNKLNIIYNAPMQELHERAVAAREYFDNVIREYFEDPTYYFLNWIDSSGR